MPPKDGKSQTFQGKDGVGPSWRGKPAPGHRKSEARSRIFRELVHIAAEQGASIRLGISTAEALQECLDRAVSLMRFAAEAVDSLHTAHDGSELSISEIANGDIANDPLFTIIPNPQGPDLHVPHRYLQMEREARMEVEKLAAMMTQLGIAERVVRVREAEAAIMISLVREAAVQAGFDNDMIRRLGASLRDLVAEGDLQKRQPSRGTVGPGKEVVEINRELEDALPGTARDI